MKSFERKEAILKNGTKRIKTKKTASFLLKKRKGTQK